MSSQTAVPIVSAVAQSARVAYAEAVTSMSSRAAGPGMRATIDEFNETAAAAMQLVGGAQRAKAILLLNPAEPPIPMRTTVFCLVTGPADEQRIEADVLAMVEKVGTSVPGYRLKHRVQFDACAVHIPQTGAFTGTKVTVLLEIAGVET